jgi:hypothetical protein
LIDINFVISYGRWGKNLCASQLVDICAWLSTSYESTDLLKEFKDFLPGPIKI